MTPEENTRYDRQMRLPQVGAEGQKRLHDASVLIVGAGGLGSPAALYLAASGVGRIGLVDFDRVDLSNLHRQVLYTDVDVGRPKVEVAAERLRAANPHVEIETHDSPFGPENGLELVSRYDLVLDGTDAFAARYLVNDACVLAGTPNVFGSVTSFEGQVTVVSNNGPCYRCVFPQPPPAGLVPSCAEAGVLGVVPGLIGILQATEALKLLLNIGDPLKGRLLLADLLSMRFREIEIEKDPACPVCGEKPSIRSLADSARSLADTCGPQFPTMSHPEISVTDLKTRLDQGEDLFLLDVRNVDEHEEADIGGALIPLPQLSNRVDELEPHRDREIVVYCRSGGRSKVAVDMLRARGFEATNMAGGILAWRDQVDPSVGGS